MEIILKNGFSIKCRTDEKIWNGKKFVLISSLKVNDEIPIRYGQNKFNTGLKLDGFTNSEHVNIGLKITPNLFTDDFFYVLGIMCADGHHTNLCASINSLDFEEVNNIIKKEGFNCFKDNKGSKRFLKPSVNYCAFLKYLGFPAKARIKDIPDKILECSKRQLKFFIQGIFDANGWSSSCSKRFGEVLLSCLGNKLAKKVNLILLNFGIVAKIKKQHQDSEKNVPWAQGEYYTLHIGGYFAHLFYEIIGFKIKSKQEGKKYITEKVKLESGNTYSTDAFYIENTFPPKTVNNPKRITRRTIAKIASLTNDPYLISLLKDKLYYSKIVQINKKNIKDNFKDLFLTPITNNRRPNTKDRAELGTIWINKINNNVYILVAILEDYSRWEKINCDTNSFINMTTKSIIKSNLGIDKFCWKGNGFIYKK